MEDIYHILLFVSQFELWVQTKFSRGQNLFTFFRSLFHLYLPSCSYLFAFIVCAS